MTFIDTHTHLYMPDAYPGDQGAEAVERAVAAGVEMMIFPGVNEQSVAPMEALHQRFPVHTALAAGVHPDDLDDDWERQLGRVRATMRQGSYIAVGEVGIDLYRDTSHRDRQMKAFAAQIGWAVEDGGLPVIIHCREGLDETLEVIRSFAPQERPPLLFHSFTYSPAEARRILADVPDAMFGINGVVTFKNAPYVREAVKEIGIGRIVLETDAPYLAPVPHRGKRNESAWLPRVAEVIAATLGVSTADVAQTTTANALRFFNL